jgi:hypothetical protein
VRGMSLSAIKSVAESRHRNLGEFLTPNGFFLATAMRSLQGKVENLVIDTVSGELEALTVVWDSPEGPTH